MKQSFKRLVKVVFSSFSTALLPVPTLYIFLVMGIEYVSDGEEGLGTWSIMGFMSTLMMLYSPGVSD